MTAIIGIAAEEVDGVHRPTVAQAARGLVAHRRGVRGQHHGRRQPYRGLSVDVGEQQAAADITVNVEYGRSIPR